MHSLERWKGKVAIVTAASTGIGATISKLLVRAGVKVVCLAMKLENVQALQKQLTNQKGQLYPFATNHAKESDIIKAFDYAKTLGPIHILINNAGILKDTNLADDDTHNWREVLNTSVETLAVATREAVNNMSANRVQGHIVHINSVVGTQALPPINDYVSFRFAVNAITDMFRHELHFSKNLIKLSSVSPGFVNTEPFEVAPSKKASVSVSGPEATRQTFKWPALNVEDVVMAVRFVLSAPSHVQVNELILEAIS